MGASIPSLMRVVLDTNVLVSALLFSGGTSRLVPLWQTGRLQLLVSKEILEEYLRVLAYPRFRLSEEDVRMLIEEEVPPFAGAVRVRRRYAICRDPDDDRFLECALAGKADRIVTGDRDLLVLSSCRGIPILTPEDLIQEILVDP